MFTKNAKTSFDGTPIEIIRRYGPLLLGTFASLSLVVSLYVTIHDGAEDMFAETQGGVIEIISTSKTETVSTISSFT
jgi:hypothetical protein